MENIITRGAILFTITILLLIVLLLTVSEVVSLDCAVDHASAVESQIAAIHSISLDDNNAILARLVGCFILRL